MTHRRISRGLVVLLVLFAASLAAWAAGAPTVGISSPSAHTLITADSQQIAVTVSAAGGAKVAYLELYVDGSLHTARRLSPPIESGEAALSWATSQFLNGEHAVSVIAHDTAGESATASVNLRLERPGGPEITLPVVTITSPRDGATLSDKARVTMEARAPGGIKYVMLFIDEVFTCFTNMPPFEYLWNTTRSENREYVLQAKAFDAAERGGLSEKITVRVNNPGGRTTMEPESAPQPAAAEPAKAIATPEPSEPVEASGPSVSVAQPALAETVSSTRTQASRANPQHEPVKIAQLPASLAGVPAGESPARKMEAASAPIVAGPPQAVSAAPVVAPPDWGRFPTERTESSGSPSRTAALRPFGTLRVAPSRVEGRQAQGRPVQRGQGHPERSRGAAHLAPEPVRIAKAPAMGRLQGVAAPVSTATPPVIATAAGAARQPEPTSAALRSSASPEPMKIAKAPAMGRQQGAAAPVSTATPVLIAKAPSAVREVTAIEQSPAGLIFHTVRPGQELGRIARTYGVSAETLAAANSLAAGRALAAGEILRVPVAKGELYLDGRRLATDVPTLFVSGIAAGPFRYIVERSGGTVTWSPADRSVAASGFGKDIRLWVGKAEAQVDGESVTLDLAAFIHRDRTMVPLRFFRDALDYAVTYDEESGRIYIARR